MAAPLPSPSPSRGAVLTRRAALLGVTATATAACSPYSFDRQRRRPAPPSPTVEPTPEVDPDVELAATVLAAEQEMLDRLDRTVERHRRLARVLAGTRAVHEAHVALLADAVPDPDAAAADPFPSPTGPDRRRVPADPLRALRDLARREDELSTADKRSAFAAESGAFARVLASMAAAAAQQATVLRDARPRGGPR